MMLSTKETPGGITFNVRVLPRSSRNEIAGEQDGALKVKLTAPPVEGAANKALVDFLSRQLHLPKSRITITSGQTGRNKVLTVEGVTAAELRRALAP